MKILVVEDDPITRLAVKSQLENPGNEIQVGTSAHVVTAVPSLAEARAALAQDSFDYAIIDLKLGTDRMAGKTLLKEIVKAQPRTICIMMTSNGADEAVEECLKIGASEYIIKPFEDRIVHILMRKARIVHRLWQQNRLLRQGQRSSVEPIWLQTKAPSFKRALEDARKLRGKQNLAIFIGGESGAGKDAFARYLWTLEEDETRPFVAVNMGAIPDNLVESELFGFKKNAFSGANENKIGKFEAADGGDIFLDEVAEMPQESQVKLLRVLQQREVVPLGSGDLPPKKVNLRVISATNANMKERTANKQFREDLFFRLQMVKIEIPPLRERMEDIEDLVQYFLEKASGGMKRLSDDAWTLCRDYRWPGNVRELENAIEVAAQLTDGPEIRASDLRPRLQSEIDQVRERSHSNSPAGQGPYGLAEERIRGCFDALMDGFQQELVRFALDKAGSVCDAAKYLGVARTTLISKISKWGWKNP